jgi:hypothetical protein
MELVNIKFSGVLVLHATGWALRSLKGKAIALQARTGP